MSAIPSTGPVKLGTHLRSVLGGAAGPVKLSDYYADAATGHAAGVDGIPASPAAGALRLGMFRGKTKPAPPPGGGGGTAGLPGGAGLWLDASATSSMTLSGGKVSQWRDVSGNSIVFNQPTLSQQPTYSAAGFRGSKPCLLLGARVGMTSLASAMGEIASSPSLTVFAAARATARAYGVVLANWYGASGQDMGQSGYRMIFMTNFNGASLFANAATMASLGPTSAGQDYVLGSVYDASGGTSAVHLGAAQKGFTPPGAMRSTAAVANSVFALGDVRAAWDFSCDALAELIAYPRALTDAEVQSVKDYLGAKYS